MTFIIRQITKRASGQDIVRDRQIDQARLTVGRATSNDIFLGDLRVGLEHLVMEVSGSRLSVQALAEKKFVIDGKTVNQVTLSDARPRQIQVGPYGLKVSLNNNGLWLVEVERLEAEETLREKDVDDIFTLRGTGMGKRGPAWLFFAVALAVFLVLPILWFHGALPGGINDRVDLDQSWLSGELSGAHANLEGECEACHKKAFEHVTDATCLECHEGLGNHAQPRRLTSAMAEAHGFDGLLVETAAFFGKEQGECADCHREHNGEDGIVLNNSSLCTDCHLGMSERLADTTLLDASDFGTDHPNFHATVVTTPGAEPISARFSLDDPALQDNSGLKFPHDIHLSVDGGVARQAQELAVDHGFGNALVCADCHTEESGGMLFEPVDMEANCQMCHSLVFETDGTVERKLPHGQPAEVVAILREYYKAKALGQAVVPTVSDRRRPGSTSLLRQSDRQQSALVDAERNANTMIANVFSEGGACYDCHQVVEPPLGTVDYRIMPVALMDRFMTKGLFNHAKHEVGDLTCESCHEASVSDSATHVLLPGIDTRPSMVAGGDEVVGCRDCHAGETASGDLVPSPCIDCHIYHDVAHAPQMTAGLFDGVFGPVPPEDAVHKGVAQKKAALSGPDGFSPGRWVQ